jgi:universal stress protein E
MPCFQNILVGVDLTDCRRLDISELSSNARETIDHAVWLAKLHSARLLFFSVLPISGEALQRPCRAGREKVTGTIEALANGVLEELVRRAAEQGVDARARLVLGKEWEEITYQVLRAKHDLVIIPAQNLGGLHRILFGNTALKLFRHCPCPVWVVKPGQSARPLNILVATDLKGASENILRLGASLGKLMDSGIHVLHVLDYPLDSLWGMGTLDEDTAKYHKEIRAAAEQTLQDQLHRLEHNAAGARVQVHFAEAVAVIDVAVEHFVRTHHIDLLVMGTIARGGVVGITIGNTAERLLSEVDCSVLVVKPPDYVSPVKLKAAELVPNA